MTRDSLKRLLDLQRVDTAIDRLRQRKADLPEQAILDEILASLDEVKAAHAAKQEELEVFSRDQSKLEGEVQMLAEKIAHESERLYGGVVTSPKELASIQAELDGLRRRKNHLEDQDLEIMERREALDAELAALAEQRDALERQAEEATAVRDAASVEIEKDLSENEAARAGILPQVPEELLELYDDLRPKKGGVAAAAMQGGVCRGCGVAISPMTLDTFKRADAAEIARCENCRRILVPV